MPAKQATRGMAPASPVFAGMPAPTTGMEIRSCHAYTFPGRPATIAPSSVVSKDRRCPALNSSPPSSASPLSG